MGACSSHLPPEEGPPLIIDVEQVVADAAWDMFYHSISRWQRLCLRRSNYSVEVQMNYFHFQVTDEQLFNVEDDYISDKSGDKKKNRHAVKGELANRQLTHQSQTAPEHLGLETEFNNSTGERQTYNFKFEKTRKASINVSFQKGFCIGGKASFSLGLPKVLPDGKASGEVDMRVTVTKTTGETFEQTLTTCTTSDITVAPHSHYLATVVMEERNLLADFKVWVMMSMPAQQAHAVIRDRQGAPVFHFKPRNLAELFPPSTHLPGPDGQPRTDAVEFLIEGRVDGMQLASHRINLADRGLESRLAQAQP